MIFFFFLTGILLTHPIRGTLPTFLTLLTWYPYSPVSLHLAHSNQTHHTPTLTPLKSESTSESSRLSSCGTFLFFSKCSSRLFWQEEKDKKTNERRRWKHSLMHSWILKPTVSLGRAFFSLPNFFHFLQDIQHARWKESRIIGVNPEKNACRRTHKANRRWTFTL